MTAQPSSLEAVPDNWTPTAANINALPEPLRRYIHDLETNCDPSGTVREVTQLRDTVHGLELMYRRAADERDGLHEAARNEFMKGDAGVRPVEEQSRKVLEQALRAVRENHRFRADTEPADRRRGFYTGSGAEAMNLAAIAALETALGVASRAVRSATAVFHITRALVLLEQSDRKDDLLRDHLNSARDALRALPHGVLPSHGMKLWQTVPKEPTPEMCFAAAEAAREYMQETGGNSPVVIYRAMLAAAPAHGVGAPSAEAQQGGNSDGN